ncbi:adenosine deaminase-like protein isoform X1 [Cyprinodon tularosa]|uniref:adenosine deaminase-like protein isoform X1 n=1 Tax=Cyprinodon tularosa TaxID=77115 RepID=UPI0018E2172F|nr:adenosine deaminase-like protein isoform X1 [Cyprinodon tularosa]
MEDDVFYKELPKVELHAHLNGSVSVQSIEKLIQRKPELNIQQSMTAIGKGQRRTLDECFEVFKVIHKLVDSQEDILMVATDVINEFAADNVKYLELRSTPRAEKDTGLTKKNYVEAVIKAIQQCKEEGVDIDVRFLVAIDRRNGTEVAMETVKLAEEFMLSSGGLVVGIDLSGDPTVGRGRDLLPALEKARNSGLKLSLHMSEVPSQREESELLLNLPPDRIGHGTFLHPEMGGSQSLVDRVVDRNIPLGKPPRSRVQRAAFGSLIRSPSLLVEICLTSNVKGQTVSSYSQHHFKYWYQLGHPCAVCTDDKGVFCTELSQEYQLAASTFGLSRGAVWTLSERAVDCIFAGEDVKQQLKQKWTEIRPGLLKLPESKENLL